MSNQEEERAIPMFDEGADVSPAPPLPNLEFLMTTCSTPTRDSALRPILAILGQGSLATEHIVEINRE
jgi:hypothetical protein